MTKFKAQSPREFPSSNDQPPGEPRVRTGRIWTVPPSGGWKAARTRTLESVRYVAQPFQAAGSRSFLAPQRAPARVGPWWEYQDAPVRTLVGALILMFPLSF